MKNTLPINLAGLADRFKQKEFLTSYDLDQLIPFLTYDEWVVLFSHYAGDIYNPRNLAKYKDIVPWFDLNTAVNPIAGVQAHFIYCYQDIISWNTVSENCIKNVQYQTEVEHALLWINKKEYYKKLDWSRLSPIVISPSYIEGLREETGQVDIVKMVEEIF